MSQTAILVDGGFYRRRAQALWGEKAAQQAAGELIKYCKRHISYHGEKNELYRIFYYDCPPLGKNVYHPLLHKTVDYGKSELFIWMTQFLEELKTQRKVALRLGSLAESQCEYNLKYSVLKKLLTRQTKLEDLTEDDFTISIQQKGVDMKIGVDIASLSYKQQVNQIVLISADSDFVPASKLARREGIDFVLDPMWANIKPELYEHIDGLRTCTPKPVTPGKSTGEAPEQAAAEKCSSQ